MKTILTQYYRRLGETLLMPDDLFEIDSQISDEECVDPLKVVPRSTKTSKPTENSFWTFPEADSKNLYAYTFSTDATALMNYARNIDGSPNAVCSVFLANAITSVYPDALSQSIDIAITINAKPILGVTKSHLPSPQPSVFKYSTSIMSQSEEMLYTCVRGKVIHDSEPDMLIKILNNSCQFYDYLSMIPSLEQKKQMSSGVLAMKICSAIVSYVGIVKFGEMEKHIESIHTYCDSAFPIVEINYINNRFFFTFSFKFSAEPLVNTFWKLMDQAGFCCSPLNTEVLPFQAEKA